MDKSLFKGTTAKEKNLSVSFKDAICYTKVIKNYGGTKQKIIMNNLLLSAKTAHTLSKLFILYNII